MYSLKQSKNYKISKKQKIKAKIFIIINNLKSRLIRKLRTFTKSNFFYFLKLNVLHYHRSKGLSSTHGTPCLYIYSWGLGFVYIERRRFSRKPRGNSS